MKHIKNLPHYMCSMCLDIKNYNFIRKTFLSFMWYIALSWIIVFAMTRIADSSEYFFNYFIISTVMTIGFLIGWLKVYFGVYYPIMRKAHKDMDMQDKYSFLYNKFTRVE